MRLPPRISSARAFLSVVSFFLPFLVCSFFISLCSSTFQSLFSALASSLPGQMLTGHSMLWLHVFYNHFRRFDTLFHVSSILTATPRKLAKILMHLLLPRGIFDGHSVQIVDTYLIWIVSVVFWCFLDDFVPSTRCPSETICHSNFRTGIPSSIESQTRCVVQVWQRQICPLTRTFKIHIFADRLLSCIQAVHGLLCQRFSSQVVLSCHLSTSLEDDHGTQMFVDSLGSTV